MRVDLKETVWRQFTFDATKEQEEIIAQAVKSGEISNSDELYEFLTDNDIEYDQEFNLETAEQMLVLENDGQATIEVFGEEDAEKAIATNEE